MKRKTANEAKSVLTGHYFPITPFKLSKINKNMSLQEPTPRFETDLSTILSNVPKAPKVPVFFGPQKTVDASETHKRHKLPKLFYTSQQPKRQAKTYSVKDSTSFSPKKHHKRNLSQGPPNSEPLTYEFFKRAKNSPEPSPEKLYRPYNVCVSPKAKMTLYFKGAFLADAKQNKAKPMKKLQIPKPQHKHDNEVTFNKAKKQDNSQPEYSGPAKTFAEKLNRVREVMRTVNMDVL